jgi:hypothetical protein
MCIEISGFLGEISLALPPKSSNISIATNENLNFFARDQQHNRTNTSTIHQP